MTATQIESLNYFFILEENYTIAKSTLEKDEKVLCNGTATSRGRVAMTLRRGHWQTNRFCQKYQCRGDETHKRVMAPEMKEAKGVLDFTTFLSTDLKILVMGDSVGMQLSQSLEELMGGSESSRTVYRYSWGDTEGLHISAPTKGGGVLAGWRILGLFLASSLDKPLPNVGGGWRMEDVYKITNHTFKNQRGQVERVGSFDVYLFFIPIGWIKKHDKINKQTLLTMVLLVARLFGVETIVLMVPSFSNNVVNPKQFQDLRALQQRVIQFAQVDFPSRRRGRDSSVKHVIALRMDRLMEETMEWNARILGLNVTSSGLHANVVTEDDWRMATLHGLDDQEKEYTQHVAQTCGELPSLNDPQKCKANMFSYDGMHMCMETMGGRVFAGFACLLNCVYPDNSATRDKCHSNRAFYGLSANVSQCADDCNDRYMSLTSLGNEILD